MIDITLVNRTNRLAGLISFILLACSSHVLAANNSANQKLPASIKQQLLTGQFKAAAKELTILSKSDNPEAQYQLAVLLLNGKGISKSASKAKELLSLSASSGNKKAIRLLEKLAKNNHSNLSVKAETQTAFINAIKNNNLMKIKDLARKGIDLNRLDDSNNPPLITAIKHNQVDIVQWLIQQPSLQLNQRDKKGNTALHCAAELNQLKILIALISASGSNTKGVELLNAKKQTPLHLATLNGHKQTAQWLISQKANADRKDSFGKTATEYAKINKLALIFESNSNDNSLLDKQILKQQIQHQLNALTKQASDKESLHYQWPILLIAVTQKQTHLSEHILQSGADPWQTNPAGESAFIIALATEQLELVDKMLNMHPIDTNRSKQSINELFALAIHKNNALLVEKLLVFMKNDQGYDRHSPLLEAIKADSPKVVEYLLKQSTEAPTGEMLHLATASNYIEVVATLLLKNPPINWQDHKGRTALWLAADNSNHELVSLFILFNAEVGITDSSGQTALMRATIKKCIACAKLLLENKADPSKASKTGNTSVMFAAQYSDEILQLFIHKDIELSKRNNQTLTPLMLAIKKNNIASVRTLLEAGANPKRRNENGQNAFDLAENRIEILSLLENY